MTKPNRSHSTPESRRETGMILIGVLVYLVIGMIAADWLAQ